MENGNQPAFGYGFANEQHYLEEKGLTKREYFAAMALQGIIAAHNIYETGINNEVNAKTAVNAADELLKQLKTKQP